MSTQPAEGNSLFDVAGAAAHMGVSEAFVRRLVLERRVRYFKVGKFVRFRAVDLDAFVEAGRQDPVDFQVYVRSIQGRGTGRSSVQPRTAGGKRGDSTVRRRSAGTADTG